MSTDNAATSETQEKTEGRRVPVPTWKVRETQMQKLEVEFKRQCKAFEQFLIREPKDSPNLSVSIELQFNDVETLYQRIKEASDTMNPKIRQLRDQVSEKRNKFLGMSEPVAPRSTSKCQSKRSVYSNSSRQTQRTSASQAALRKLELQQQAFIEEQQRRERIAEMQTALEKERIAMETANRVAQFEMQRIEIEIQSETASHRSEHSTTKSMEDPAEDPWADHRKSSQEFVCRTPRNANAYPCDNDILRTSTSLPRPKDSVVTQLVTQAYKSHLPVIEPEVFYGDPLKFPQWKANFSSLFDSSVLSASEKLMYLKRYVGGPAKRCIEGMFLGNDEASFQEALRILEQRYGSSYLVAESIMKKICNWPKLPNRDPKMLREFTDYLRCCEAVARTNVELQGLNDPFHQRTILNKMPDWICAKWNEHVFANAKQRSFSDMVQFLVRLSEIENNPITSISVLRAAAAGRETSKCTQPEEIKKHREIKQVRDIKTHELSDQVQKCLKCERFGHKAATCFDLRKLSYEEQEKFIKNERLCYGCLEPGHVIASCKSKAKCHECGRRHPTSLHDHRRVVKDKSSDKPDEAKDQLSESDKVHKATTRSTQIENTEYTMSSLTFPVWIKADTNDVEPQLTYALVDSQSDTSFISENLLKSLHVGGESTRIELETMSTSSTVSCKKIDNLRIWGYYKTEAEAIDLPTCYSSPAIPSNKSHIPTKATAELWPYLSDIEIPEMQDIEVGLLLGYNCPKASKPLQVIASDSGDQPYAQKTALGWAIVGCNVKLPESCDPRHCRRTQMRANEVERSLKALEGDFMDLGGHEKYSQEDLRFIKILEEGIHQLPNKNLELPLPFRNERPPLNDNKAIAQKRLSNLRRRFDEDSSYANKYKETVQTMLDREDAEEVPEKDANLPAWYIPHHGVFHPKKQKLRVVFDCSSKCKGRSLNDTLLQGPDMLNALVGVLTRFRQKKVAFTCDVEKMFYCFYVNAEH